MCAKAIFVIFFLFVCRTGYAASSYFVTKTESVGEEDPHDPEVFSELVANYLEEEGRLARSKEGADALVQPVLIDVSDGYRMVLKINPKSGERRTISLKVEYDEVDLGARRLAKALARGRKAEQTLRVADVSKIEARTPSRDVGNGTEVYLGFGQGGLSGYEKLGLTRRFDLGLRFHASDNLDIRLEYISMAARSSDHEKRTMVFSALASGVDYFFSEENLSPFVGVDFGSGSLTLIDKVVDDQQASSSISINGSTRTTPSYREESDRRSIMLLGLRGGLAMLRHSKWTIQAEIEFIPVFTNSGYEGGIATFMLKTGWTMK
jgi:hypothetical protein